MRKTEIYDDYMILEEYHYGYRVDDILLQLTIDDRKTMYEAFNNKDVEYIKHQLQLPFDIEIRKYNLMEFRILPDIEDSCHLGLLVCFGVYPDLQEDNYIGSDLHEWNSARPKRSVKFPSISEYVYLTAPPLMKIIDSLYDRSELFKHDEQNVRIGKIKKLCFEQWFNDKDEE